jgi:hypothetical protein
MAVGISIKRLYAEFHYAECLIFYYYAELHYAECYYAEFHYSECRGAISDLLFSRNFRNISAHKKRTIKLTQPQILCQYHSKVTLEQVLRKKLFEIVRIAFYK